MQQQSFCAAAALLSNETAKSKIDKAGIYVDGYALRKLLKRAQYVMTKTDRIIYGTPVLQECGTFLSSFVLAYEYPDERDKYIRKMIADFEVLKLDLRIIAEENVLKCPDPANALMRPDGFKIQIFELVARIDEGITKWRKCVEKGKTDAVRDIGSADEN